jgi:hypothetical protein
MYLSYSQVFNPQWMDAEHTYIMCEVKFDHLLEAVPFGASPRDCTAHGVEIFNRCAAGDFGPVTEYIPPLPPPESDPTVGEPNVIG